MSRPEISSLVQENTGFPAALTFIFGLKNRAWPRAITFGKVPNARTGQGRSLVEGRRYKRAETQTAGAAACSRRIVRKQRSIALQPGPRTTSRLGPTRFGPLLRVRKKRPSQLSKIRLRIAARSIRARAAGPVELLPAPGCCFR